MHEAVEVSHPACAGFLQSSDIGYIIRQGAGAWHTDLERYPPARRSRSIPRHRRDSDLGALCYKERRWGRDLLYLFGKSPTRPRVLSTRVLRLSLMNRRARFPSVGVSLSSTAIADTERVEEVEALLVLDVRMMQDERITYRAGKRRAFFMCER